MSTVSAPNPSPPNEGTVLPGLSIAVAEIFNI